MYWTLVFVPFCWCIPNTAPSYEDNVTDIGLSADDKGYEIASEILRKSINFSANPCEDFFEFTCGNWIASNPIPKDKVSYGHVEILEDKVQEQMRDLFESNEVFGSKAVNALKAFYKKCMDKDELNRIGAKRLIENVKSFGVWPALEGDDKWKEENYNLTSLLIHVYRSRRVLAFVNFDLDDTKIRRLIQFGRGNLFLDKDEYLDREKNGTYIGALKKFLTRQIEEFQRDGGLPTNKSKIEKDVDEIIDLEFRIAEIMDADVDDTDSHIKINHLWEMQKLMPLVNWRQFFSAVAPFDSQEYLASDPKILVNDHGYMSRVNELLQSTDPRIITNYVFMLFSQSFSITGEMGEKYEDIKQEYIQTMYEKQRKIPRWKFCTGITMRLMNYATTALYVKKALHENAKEDVFEIANALKEEFREILNTSKWIDDETRNEALNKLEHMVRQVAYPKFILDEERLDRYYGEMDVRDTDSLGEMVEKVIQWRIKNFFKQLMTVLNRFVIFNSADVNASYKPYINSLQVKAGILHPPFFHHTFPRALNYGGIGAVIGHEITHGFDIRGRRYDAFGVFRKWWYDDEEEDEQRSQCLIDQYGKIEVPGTGYKVKGKRTLQENIADHGGVKLAYRHGGKEERIKGLEQFNNEQMFFLGYATIWCGHKTNDAMIDTIRKDVHAPKRYRVNQVLANQPEFAAAFNCEVGSAMNPSKRCAVW
ncbi:unnamed protein product [Cylicocyclus nassatus]|uniref:Uncharacterized protein n=1 Tax=Cylicocyclus nassatus TaxID=53992 RepID=A0AA36H856_CYLNA|nr:unnamed protein product [Cylicocyclus nassatus]